MSTDKVVMSRVGDMNYFFNKSYKFNFFCNESSYGIGFKDRVWLKNGTWNVIIDKKTFDKDTLEFKAELIAYGLDNLGYYKSATYRWSGEIEVTLQFKVYEQSFIITTMSIDKLASDRYVEVNFPLFSHSGSLSKDLHVAVLASAYPKIWPLIKIFKPPNALEKFAKAFNDGTEFLPLWIYDEEMSIVMLPANHFIDYRIVNIKRDNELGFSLRLSGICSLPRLKVSAILYYSKKGPSETLIEAGELLKRIYNKTPISKDIFPLRYLGYSTANGSYYFNRFNEEVILRVMNRMKEEGIPIKWIQLDVMWYRCGIHPDAQRTFTKFFKGKFSEENGLRYVNIAWAIHELKPDKKYFPNQLANVRLPIGVWIWTTRFTEDSPYKREYPWIREENLPQSKDFWMEIAKSFREYNIIWVETDNLCDILNRKGLKRIGEKEKWFLNMLKGFEEYSIPVQLCMTPGIIYPIALKSKSASFIRTGEDFRLYPDHVKVYQDFYNTVLAWAFSLYPCFDVFFTSKDSYVKCDELTPEDWGFPEIGYITANDANPLFQLLAHSLSCGVTYIGDPLDSIDKHSIKLICSSTTGEVIKADRPAIPVRQCYLKDPLFDKFPLIVYSTVGEHVILGVFNLIGETLEYEVPLSDLGIQRDCYSFEFFSRKVRYVEKYLKESIEPKSCNLYILCPILSGIGVVGDINKFIAPYIIKDIQIADSSVIIITESTDDANLAIISTKKPKEVLVNTSIHNKWRYTESLVEIALTPGRHVVELIL